MPGSVRVVLALRNVGVLGYLAGPDVHLTDLLGLADPVAARLTLVERSRPGHEKMLPDAWVVARFGDPEARERFPSAADAARAMDCGDLADLLHAVSDPLTLSRFFANLGAAWSFHRLRIPADPAAAALRFCTRPARAGRPAAGRSFAG